MEKSVLGNRLGDLQIKQKTQSPDTETDPFNLLKKFILHPVHELFT